MTVATVDQRKRLRAARRLLHVQPASTLADRMGQAAEILTGRSPIRASVTPAERLEKIKGKSETEETEREETGGFDRKKRGGRTRKGAKG